MFEPGYDVRRIAVRRRNRTNGIFKRGTMFRAALDALRSAAGPLTAREVVEAMVAAKGIPEPSQGQIRNLFGGVHRSLINGEGKTVARVGEGMPMRWALKL